MKLQYQLVLNFLNDDERISSIGFSLLASSYRYTAMVMTHSSCLYQIYINTVRPKHNGLQFTEDIFK